MRALHLFFHLSVTVCLFLAERPICSLVCVYVCVCMRGLYSIRARFGPYAPGKPPPLLFLLLSPSPAADYVSFSAQTSRAEAKNWMIFQRHINIKM